MKKRSPKYRTRDYLARNAGGWTRYWLRGETFAVTVYCDDRRVVRGGSPWLQRFRGQTLDQLLSFLGGYEEVECRTLERTAAGERSKQRDIKRLIEADGNPIPAPV